MKQKYKKTLIIIFILFLGLLGISTGYGLWKSINGEENEVSSTTLNCFKIYYSNENDGILLTNIKPILNDEGKELSPYTLTITNICDTEKELQLRLNILEETNVDLESFTIKASGDIETEMVPFKSLKNMKTDMEKSKMSKLIGTVKIGKENTVRTNLKMWFDEKKVNEMNPDAILKARFELVDAATAAKNNFSETVLLDHPINETEVDFASTALDGLFKTKDANGDAYYFRGIVEDNYVSFANESWRIVSIDSSGNVKLVHNGNIGTSIYSKYRNSIDYTGLKYIYNGSTIDNQINKYLLSWYEENIKEKGFDKNIAETNYCNDSSSILEGYHRYFGGYTRIITNKTPSMICSETKEDFGGIVKQKIALLTIDEVVMSGLVDGVNNTTNYLYQGNDYYTMSPAEYYNYTAYVFYVNGAGQILRATPTDKMTIRPVITIESSTTVGGKGTKEEPYYIKK